MDSGTYCKYEKEQLDPACIGLSPPKLKRHTNNQTMKVKMFDKNPSLTQFMQEQEVS